MISIVIPTYNEEKYLPKLLESIKKQSYKDYEIIIADNNSKDNTRKLAKKYGCKVVEGGRPGVARQNGGQAAKYDIIFMDADVVLPKNFLERFLKEIDEKNLDLATCTVRPISKKINHKIFYWTKNFGINLFHIFYSHANGQCFYSKKAVFRKTGFNTKLRHGDEHDFVNRAKKHGKFRIIKNLYVLNYPRRLEEVGAFKLFWISLYPEFIRFFKRDLDKQIVNYDWGNHP